MNRKQIIVLWVLLIVIIPIVVIFAVMVWPTKYEYLPSGEPYLALRINRLTGEAEGLHRSIGWKKLQKTEPGKAEPGKTETKITILPPEEAKKIDAASTIEQPLSHSPISKDFIVKVYNGSSYTLREITITITAKEKNGDIRWSRQFRRGDINIAPEESGGRRIEIPSFDGAELSYTIDEFRGTIKGLDLQPVETVFPKATHEEDFNLSDLGGTKVEGDLLNRISKKEKEEKSQIDVVK